MPRLLGRLAAAGSLAAAFLAPAFAQQPAKPALPPIDPAKARLDQTVTGLDGPGFGIAANEEAGMLAAACEGGTVQCWNKDVSMGVRVGERTAGVLKGHKGPVTALAWHGGRLASAGADGKVILWAMPGGKPLHTLTAKGPVRALALSPDGKQVAAAGDDPAVQLWDTESGKPGEKLAGHTDWVLSLAYSGDGKLLASGGYDGTVKVWEAASGKKLLDVPALPPAPKNAPERPANVVQALAFSPDGKLLAVGGSDAAVHLFSVPDGKFIRSLAGHASSVTALVFHPGGAVLASGSKDRTVRLWNPANGQALKSLEGHTAWVQGVVFLAQGTRLASAGADQTVRLWDLTPEPKK
ncbi:MAG TPA: WD40 repeat domain-containing protein [Gemmataceae bacterium]|nr:WD40 repeat domain-containing protein [Gemmataceae bacterium]